MSEITLEKISILLAAELKPLNARMDRIEQTLDRHTGMLDGLAKDVKTVLERQSVTDHRLERLEHWAQDAGSKIGIILDL